MNKGDNTPLLMASLGTKEGLVKEVIQLLLEYKGSLSLSHLRGCYRGEFLADRTSSAPPVVKVPGPAGLLPCQRRTPGLAAQTTRLVRALAGTLCA